MLGVWYKIPLIPVMLLQSCPQPDLQLFPRSRAENQLILGPALGSSGSSSRPKAVLQAGQTSRDIPYLMQDVGLFEAIVGLSPETNLGHTVLHVQYITLTNQPQRCSTCFVQHLHGWIVILWCHKLAAHIATLLFLDDQHFNCTITAMCAKGFKIIIFSILELKPQLIIVVKCQLHKEKAPYNFLRDKLLDLAQKIHI